MGDLIRDTTLIDRERYRVRQRREKSPAPGGVWTHDLSVTRRGSNVVLQLLPYNCFTYNPYLPGPLFLSFFLYYFFLAALKVKAANFSRHWFHLFAHKKKYFCPSFLTTFDSFVRAEHQQENCCWIFFSLSWADPVSGYLSQLWELRESKSAINSRDWSGIHICTNQTWRTLHRKVGQTRLGRNNK